MLHITIPAIELYDESTNLFITLKPQDLQLEHSLVSVSKWESKWKKPFLTRGVKTREEEIDYLRAMTITQNVPAEVYQYIPDVILLEVRNYIEDSMTATIINKPGGGTNREVITAELIYYWMISFNVPFECQRWHLNRLLTLINVCSFKNQPGKKMSNSEILARNHALNEARRAKLNTHG